jgi:hypothetical protein
MCSSALRPKYTRRTYNGLVMKSCLTAQHLSGINGFLAHGVKWNYKFPPFITREFFEAQKCVSNNHVAVVQIMPVLATAPRILFYDSCFMGLVAACKRHVIRVPDGSDTVLDNIENYMFRIILPELRILLKDFHYSLDVYYNHLTSSQQLEFDRLDLTTLGKRNCCVFCKGEKQQQANEPPKNRCISAMCAQHKYVMGAVVYALEQYMKKFKGYGGGLNWIQTGECYDRWAKNDYTVIQSDVSGMDRSVKMRLKNIIFDNIYKLIEDKVQHVDRALWDLHAYPILTTMIAKSFVDKSIVDLGSATVEGTVFSGSCDTTLMNTLVTVIIQRYTLDTYLSNYDYDLKGKGDDSVVVVFGKPDTIDIRNAYARVYYFTDQIKSPYMASYFKHGCGMTLKFLQISDSIDDIDFCSTNCFFCKNCNKYRVTRKIDRFIELSPWSSAVVNLPNTVRLAYYQNLYDSNNKWMKGLPIFTQLNNYLRTGVTLNYTLSGRQKKILPLNEIDALWYQKFFSNEPSESILSKFGKSDLYSMLNQTGDIQPCCGESYYDWLFEKLNLNRVEVDIICRQLEIIENDRYDCPLLTDALQYFESYKALKCYR